MSGRLRSAGHEKRTESLLAEALALAIEGTGPTGPTGPAGVSGPTGVTGPAALGGSVSVTSGLGALPTGGSPAGTLAYVASRQAYFSYAPLDAQAPNGTTVVAALGGGNWLYFASANVWSAIAQTTWFFDILAGSDDNTGLVGFPVQHKAEAMRRVGGWSPDINGITVTMTYLSPDTDDSDPGMWTPNFRNGGTLIHTAALPAPAFTGTILSVTPNSVPGNNTLQSTFTTSTGSISRYMLLINSTRANSSSVAQRNISGSNWQLSQPMAVLPPGPPLGTQNNAWANGDSVQGYVPLAVNLNVVGGRVADYLSPFNPSHQVRNITLFTQPPTSFSGLFADAGCFFLFNNCVGPQCNVTVGGNQHVAASNYIVNCMFSGLICDAAPPIALKTALFGAVVSNLRLNGGTAVGVIVESHGDLSDCSEGVGPVFIDNGVIVRGWGAVGLPAAPAIIYGPGTYTQLAGTLTYSGTAAASIPVATLQLNGVATGYSNATSGGVVTVHGGIALTAANLDAAAGATGFGGYAYGGGATISKAGVQP